MKLPKELTDGLDALSNDAPINLDLRLSLITHLIDYVRSAKELDRVAIRSKLGREHFEWLHGYALQMSMRAVRSQSIVDIRRGLTALALECGRDDDRETTSTLCLLHHSALKLFANPDLLFHEAASFGDNEGRNFLLGYLENGSKSIDSMGLKEGYDSDGFVYTQLPYRRF